MVSLDCVSQTQWSPCMACFDYETTGDNGRPCENTIYVIMLLETMGDNGRYGRPCENSIYGIMLLQTTRDNGR